MRCHRVLDSDLVSMAARGDRAVRFRVWPARPIALRGLDRCAAAGRASARVLSAGGNLVRRSGHKVCSRDARARVPREKDAMKANATAQ
jgi:hypothetical protein